MNDAEMILKSKGTVTKKVSFPLIFFEEFENDAKVNFNNTYYNKIMFDHQFRKQFESISNLLIQDIVELKEHVFELNAKIAELEAGGLQEKEEKKVRKTFG